MPSLPQTADKPCRVIPGRRGTTNPESLFGFYAEIQAVEIPDSRDAASGMTSGEFVNNLRERWHSAVAPFSFSNTKTGVNVTTFGEVTLAASWKRRARTQYPSAMPSLRWSLAPSKTPRA